MVGRNLMRHYVDLYAVAKGTAQRRTGNDKEIALGDHYAGSAGKLGSFQAFGALPPVPVTLASMRADIANARGALAAAAFDVGKPVLGWLLRRIDERALVFASILEDLPFRDNRVFAVDDASGPTTAIHYRIAPGEAHRIARFRAIVRQMLSGRRFLAIRQAENNQRLAHACGTCRFGDDPRVSVLDRDNRAHGIANLYVVDASCFPSSGGTNPALTIAANALRVADRLVRAC
jgi:choline dehydrogenase-like flavoprotein